MEHDQMMCECCCRALLRNSSSFYLIHMLFMQRHPCCGRQIQLQEDYCWSFSARYDFYKLVFAFWRFTVLTRTTVYTVTLIQSARAEVLHSFLSFCYTCNTGTYKFNFFCTDIWWWDISWTPLCAFRKFHSGRIFLLIIVFIQSWSFVE